jgi:hypothetical protein
MRRIAPRSFDVAQDDKVWEDYEGLARKSCEVAGMGKKIKNG